MNTTFLTYCAALNTLIDYKTYGYLVTLTLFVVYVFVVSKTVRKKKEKMFAINHLYLHLFFRFALEVIANK